MNCLNKFWDEGNYSITFSLPKDTTNPTAPYTGSATISKLSYDNVIPKGYSINIPLYYQNENENVNGNNPNPDTLSYLKDKTFQYESGGTFGLQWAKWEYKKEIVSVTVDGKTIKQPVQKMSTYFWGSGDTGNKIIMKIIFYKVAPKKYKVVTYNKEYFKGKWVLTNEAVISPLLL